MSLLSHMYIDSMDVYRTIDDVTEWGETVHERRLIHEKVPCRLTNSNMSNQEGVNVVSQGQFTLFCEKEVDLLEGDELHVTTNQNQTHILYATRPFKYPTHLEVQCTSEKDV